jgi:hypothetical protein
VFLCAFNDRNQIIMVQTRSWDSRNVGKDQGTAVLVLLHTQTDGACLNVVGHIYLTIVACASFGLWDLDCVTNKQSVG